MHNLVKLVQASGKALLVPADAISSGIVRSLSRKEQDANPKAASFLWVVLNGMAQTALVRERMGFILNKAGGSSSEREVVEGVDGERISMPRAIFSYAIEAERITDARGNLVPLKDVALREKRGEEVIRTDATALHTTLNSPAGPVSFYVKDSAADLFDLFTAEVSEDDDGEEYGEDGTLIVNCDPEPVSPAPRSNSARPARRKRPSTR
ncbi:hypothetical protein WBP07_12850 [Novosphingobium sp. BL-8A]|uniref:hypothetical protein n=1 Tax=Novosphingobium sp. BL-8A TaxID=3127639 RepID=UPI00375746AC